MNWHKVRNSSAFREGPSLKISDLLFGYDYFIAHRSIDGKLYAKALYEALTSKGNELDCFLDVKNYDAGGSLPWMQARAIRKTSRLIIIVTPHAHDPEADYLRDEVIQFKIQHRNGVIVPIGTARTLRQEAFPKSLLLPYVPNLDHEDICILEDETALLSGSVSSATLAKLLNDFSEQRKSAKRLKWIRVVAILMTLLAIAAVSFGLVARSQKKQITRQRDNLKEQLAISKANLAGADAVFGEQNVDALMSYAASRFQILKAEEFPKVIDESQASLELTKTLRNRIPKVLGKFSKVFQVSYSPNKKYLAFIVKNGTESALGLFSFESGVTKSISGQFTALCFAPDGQSIAVGAQVDDGAELYLYDLALQKIISHRFESVKRENPKGDVHGMAPPYAIYDLTFSADGDAIVVSGTASLRPHTIFEYSSWIAVFRVKENDSRGYVSSRSLIDFRPKSFPAKILANGRQAAAFDGAEVYLFDLRDGTRTVIGRHDAEITDLACSASSGLVAVVGTTNTVTLFTLCGDVWNKQTASLDGSASGELVEIVHDARTPEFSVSDVENIDQIIASLKRSGSADFLSANTRSLLQSTELDDRKNELITLLVEDLNRMIASGGGLEPPKPPMETRPAVESSALVASGEHREAKLQRGDAKRLGLGKQTRAPGPVPNAQDPPAHLPTAADTEYSKCVRRAGIQSQFFDSFGPLPGITLAVSRSDASIGLVEARAAFAVAVSNAELNANDAPRYHELGRHSEQINDLVVSSNRDWVVTCSSDKTARAWAIRGGFREVVFRNAQAALRRMAAAPSLPEFIIYGDDGAIYQWDAEDEHLLAIPGNPTCRRPEPRVENWGGNRFIGLIPFFDAGFVTNAEWSPDGHHFMTATSDGLIVVRNENFEEERRLFLPGDRVAEFTQDSRYVLSTRLSANGFDLLRVADGKRISVDAKDYVEVQGASFSVLSEWALIEDSGVLVTRPIDAGVDARIVTGEFSPSGNYFAAIQGRDLRIWRRDTNGVSLSICRNSRQKREPPSIFGFPTTKLIWRSVLDQAPTLPQASRWFKSPPGVFQN